MLERLNPPTAPKPFSRYSQAVLAPQNSEWLYISGQVGCDRERNVVEVVREAAQEVVRPIVFGVSIITVVFLPLFTLEGIEGKMFIPLAFTTAAALAGYRGPGSTRDGHPVQVLANVQDGAGAQAAAAAHAEGVGLLRTELAFFGRSEEPSVEEQAQIYAGVLAAFPGGKVVLRTLDDDADDLREQGEALVDEVEALQVRHFTGPECQGMCGGDVTSDVVRDPVGRVAGEAGAPSPNTRIMMDRSRDAADRVDADVDALFEGPVTEYRDALRAAGYTPIGDLMPLDAPTAPASP